MSTQRRIEVSRTVAAPPARVFALLADPARHPEIDTSGWMRAVLSTEPLTDAGQVFVVAMHNDLRGDYRTANAVVTFARDREIGWAVGLVGAAPLGHTYTYRLAPDGEHALVTLTYDWAAMTDADLLARMPRLSAEQLRASLDRLAAALG